MEYVARKVCNFDRLYSPGEKVDASVIDASIVQKAIEQGFIGVNAPDEVSVLREQVREKDAEIERLSGCMGEAERELVQLRAQVEGTPVKKSKKAGE